MAVFGPDTARASEYAGALSITDARILAFPVRSLKGLFAWVTCPAALARLRRDLRVNIGGDIGAKLDALDDSLKSLAEDKALVATGSPLVLATQAGAATNLVLEEYDYESTALQVVADLGEVIDKALSSNTRLKTHLAIVGDDAFSHYVKYATEVLARIKLDYETKTVEGGHLFYEEFLPAEVIVYSVVVAGKPSRKLKSDEPSTDPESTLKDEADVLKYLKDQITSSAVIQIGGNATIGKGFCSCYLVEGGKVS